MVRKQVWIDTCDVVRTGLIRRDKTDMMKIGGREREELT